MQNVVLPCEVAMQKERIKIELGKQKLLETGTETLHEGVKKDRKWVCCWHHLLDKTNVSILFYRNNVFSLPVLH